MSKIQVMLGIGLVIFVGCLMVAQNAISGSEAYFIDVDTYADAIVADVWYASPGDTLTFAFQNTYYTLHFNDTDIHGDITFTGNKSVDSYFTIGESGTYAFVFHASGSGQNNHEYATTLTVNNATQPRCEHIHKMAAGGDIVTHTGSCHLDLNGGDEVRMATADKTGTGNGIYYGGTLTAIKVGNL